MVRFCVRFLLVFCILSSAGCAMMRTERKVVPDNVFMSSRHPDINIKIDQSLKYIGKATASKYSKHKTHPGGSNASFESHLFGEVGENNKIKRAVIIRFLRIHTGFWLPDNFSNVKFMLDTGIVDVNDINYQYAVFPDTSPFINYEEIFLFDSGYVVPNCFIVKALARREGTNNKHKYYVAYLEAAQTILDGKYRCKSWTNRDNLEGEQREYLTTIAENYNKCIEIGCGIPKGIE